MSSRRRDADTSVCCWASGQPPPPLGWRGSCSQRPLTWEPHCAVWSVIWICTIGGAVATLTANGGVTSLGYAIHQSGVEATDQIYDLAMALVCKIMRSLC